MSTVAVHVPDEPIVITDVDPGPGRIVVSNASLTTGFVLFGTAGLQGPPGPPGAAGTAGQNYKTYTHEQPTGSTYWLIQHDLGYDPVDVLVIDNWGDVAEGWGVQYVTPGSAVALTFQIPCAGTARLS